MTDAWRHLSPWLQPDGTVAPSVNTSIPQMLIVPEKKPGTRPDVYRDTH
jgi:hypothetical protein